MTIQYLLDKQIASLYRTQLMRHDWCEIHEFILVTNNRKSMPKHLADHLAELILIAGASFPKEYQDRIEYLPLSE